MHFLILTDTAFQNVFNTLGFTLVSQVVTLSNYCQSHGCNVMSLHYFILHWKNNSQFEHYFHILDLLKISMNWFLSFFLNWATSLILTNFQCPMCNIKTTLCHHTLIHVFFFQNLLYIFWYLSVLSFAINAFALSLTASRFSVLRRSHLLLAIVHVVVSWMLAKLLFLLFTNKSLINLKTISCT